MSDILQFTGTVNVIEDIQTFSSGFKKQVITIVEEADKYPQEIPFEFIKDKTEMLRNVRQGDKVTVNYNLRGSEYKGRYYVSLQVWKVAVIQKVGDIEESVPAPDSDDELEDSPF